MASKNKGAKKGKGGARRSGRVLAFQVLFGQGFVPAETLEASVKMAFKLNPAVQDESNEVAQEFALELILGVAKHGESLDKVIERYSQNWKIKRIAKIELSILRLSIYEMMHTDIPLKVAINEGVELSKRFGDSNSRNFVNGLLDAAAKGVDAGDLGVTKSF